MSTQVRTSNQSRASTKIVIGAIVLLAGGYLAKTLWENRQLSGVHYPPLAPGKVNLVGLDTTHGGYHIIVANGLAHLIQSPSGSFGPGQSDPGQADSDDSGAEKKRVPLKELIQTLTGTDPQTVGRYISVLNDMNEIDVPPKALDWKADDVQKALNGDAALKKKLESDLNTHLDGTPLPVFRPSTFQTGIVIHLGVPLTVNTEQGSKTVTGDVEVPFQTSLMRNLESRVKDVSPLDEHSLAGFYGEVGSMYLKDATRRQDVAKALLAVISKENVATLSALPQSVLASVQVLANDSLISHASYSTQDTSRGQVYNMDIQLNDEGRKRLWQYSRDHVGDQLLLVVDGVAVAAPRIGNELAQSNLSISNMPDESIVKDATDKINGQSKQQ
jgi:hypothetical protein